MTSELPLSTTAPSAPGSTTTLPYDGERSAAQQDPRLVRLPPELVENRPIRLAVAAAAARVRPSHR